MATAAVPAYAADLAAKVPAPIAPVPGAFDFFSGIEYHVQGEAGVMGNSLNPAQGDTGKGYNFGQLYTDHANEVQLNQVLLTVTKPIDPKATGFAAGFTLQGLYGSDMRFNHFLGIGDQFMGSQRDQLNVVQAFVAFHLPVFTSGGVDLKVGLFTSPQGYETLDPSTSPFYSHSYTYNYAVTFNHTGFLSTTHINDKLDLYVGVDTGNQTSIGFPGGDPNGQIAGFIGFGLNNLLNDKLTVLALSHIGRAELRRRSHRRQPRRPLLQRRRLHLQGDRRADLRHRTELHPRRLRLRHGSSGVLLGRAILRLQLRQDLHAELPWRGVPRHEELLCRDAAGQLGYGQGRARHLRLQRGDAGRA